ncbi:MAG TPA: hypothetical protein VGE07_22940 [Herpetosiphonaceae bacterium]
MAFYWTLASIPELHDLPRAQQQQLWRRAARHAMRRLPFWGAVGGTLLLTGPLVVLLDRWSSTTTLPQEMLTFGVVVVVVLLVMNQIITRVLDLLVLGWFISCGLEWWWFGANAVLGQPFDLGLMMGLGGLLLSQLMTHLVRPRLAQERAALFPQPQHDDGSYWVPPAV